MDDFSRVYADHHRDLYGFALFLTRDAAAAEDFAADTFGAPLPQGAGARARGTGLRNSLWPLRPSSPDLAFVRGGDNPPLNLPGVIIAVVFGLVALTS